MATTQGIDAGGRLLIPSLLLRVTELALCLHAVMATIAATGFALGYLPHAAESAVLAHRAAAGEIAGALIFAFVARGLRRDGFLIVPALAFVFCNLVASVCDFVASGNASEIPALVVEAVFFAIYAAFTTVHLRRSELSGLSTAT
jgi:hypothetical protein